ncbi:uncharacterized protein MEPE_03696 [Melanopsichium pennsylvanicum]|uniref:YMC020W-like alpha/beta hydrolase domain-containing protein n=2 Tax=Melanopsichium pennsylvanicum TaxID=63383 RepID=A0AAJ4XNC5_9BASI|nr:conserved hypothetical protein [Melanopsichium pennsylvanicum 4]SNX84987.1 uncharacterized protein MEPE_03696 [Melanopsichium pennsylvanicum]
MPFTWTHDRAAAPASNSSAAPSGRISASPTQSRGHRTRLPHSTSISSNISSISTAPSARSTSVSQLPPSLPPSSLSLPRASTSAALTTADESDDFRHFLEEAQANEDRKHQSQSKKTQKLASDQCLARRAVESLRRVASSATLNSMHSMHSQRAASTPIPAPEQIAAPTPRTRGNSTLSTASRAPRSVSNYSVTFRNPTSQFLEQLSMDSHTPELGIDDTPITGRTVDNKSHLTALGHAAQLQSRTVSGSHKGRNGTIQAKAPTSQLHGPTRSSTIAVDTPTTTPSRVTQPMQRSPSSAAPTSTVRIASPRSQPLSPRCRPQSYIDKPPAQPSGVVSQRKLGAAGLGHGLPPSPKRSADEMERSSSMSPLAKVEANDGLDALEQRPSQPSLSRKTWFGLGWAAETEEAAFAKQASVKDDTMEPAKPATDQPPQLMNEEEAAFRRSLGYNDTFDPPVSPKKMQENIIGPTLFPATRDSDADATIKAEPSAAQVPFRERRASWLPWRNVAPPTAEDVSTTAEHVAIASQSSEEQKPAKSQEEAPASVSEAVTHEAAPAANRQARNVASQNQEEDTVTYRTVLKRGWMGERYEVQEPVPGLRDTFNPLTTDSSHGATSASAPKDDAADRAVQAQTAQDKTSYPPTDTLGDQARHASATWRWRFWSGQEAQPGLNASSAAQQLEVPANSEMPAAREPVQTSTKNFDAAIPMDIDQDSPPPDAPTDPEGGSWTYSSYLASWVPTWVYNTQQQAAAASAQQAQERSTELSQAHQQADTPPDAPPPTPAEQVKADALARDAAAAVLDTSKAVLNSSTKSGWIKFFASRSANLPEKMPETITNDDGMEVMDISDMERSGPAAKGHAIASSSGKRTPDASRAPRARTTMGSALARSTSSSLGTDSATPLSTSRDSIRNLSKATIIKAANVTAASTSGLGKGKGQRAESGPFSGSTSNGANSGSRSQPAKDISKSLAPNGNGPSRSGTSTTTTSAGDPAPLSPQNLVLPSFEDTFSRAPRMWAPKVGVLERTLSAVNSYLFSKVPDFERMKRPTRFSTYGESALGSTASSSKASVSSFATIKPAQRLAGKAKATGVGSSKDKDVEVALKEVASSAQRLPRAWSAVGLHDRAQTKGTAGIAKVVVIGVHGWFTQSIFKNMIGEPTGTSAKFAAMQTESIRRHFLEAGLELNPEAITAISLQGDGKVADRVDRLFSELISRPNWVRDLKEADAVFLSAHSQGAIVATQLLARLVEQRQIIAENTRICLLAMCGIHHGPFAHLKSSVTASYINYFETAAAKELFEFQSSSSSVYQQYTSALKIILDAGAKCVYVGSTDDNVVPIYSALNSSNNHPSILRALYIDGQAFPKVDFLTNLLVLCVAVRNAGLADHNLLTLLSASVAGSLYGGRGHSLVYEEKAVYDLATRYLFETTHPLGEPTFVPGPPGAKLQSTHTNSPSSAAASNSHRKVSASDMDPSNMPMLVSEAFEVQRWNPYDLPWSLRGLFEDKHIRSLFAEDMLNLLQSYEEWRPDPKSKSLKDLQFRLAPLRSIKPPPVEGGNEEEKTTNPADNKNSKL